MSIRPEEIMNEIEKSGWEISNSLSAKTSCLVVKDESEETTKMTKAKELGVPIVSFKNIINYLKNK